MLNGGDGAAEGTSFPSAATAWVSYPGRASQSLAPPAPHDRSVACKLFSSPCPGAAAIEAGKWRLSSVAGAAASVPASPPRLSPTAGGLGLPSAMTRWIPTKREEKYGVGERFPFPLSRPSARGSFARCAAPGELPQKLRLRG